MASRNACTASRAFSSSTAGTCTSTVTSRSPVEPLDGPLVRGTPRPRTRNARPLGVPAGIFSVTGAPPSVGTLISEPSAASSKLTGTVSVRLSPRRPNSGCGETLTLTYRSPGGPPCSPAAPLPRSRIRWPSLTPAGMRAEMVRFDMPRPEPWQVGHGSSTTSPRPRHVGQVSFMVNAPPTDAARMPTPSQSGQTRGSVPARAPVPEQSGHGASEESRSETVTPSIESANPIVASVSTSAPRRGAEVVRVVRPPPPPPNMPPNRSEKPPPPDDVRPVPPPKRSLRSKVVLPPPAPPVPANGPKLPTPARSSSYCLRFSASPTTS